MMKITTSNAFGELSSQRPLIYDITTNQTRFYNDEFNDYKNCICKKKSKWHCVF